MVQKRAKPNNRKQLTTAPPAYLGRKAKVIWRKLVHVLQDEQDAKPCDSSLLEAFCSQYEVYRNAYEHIKKNGEVQAIYKPIQNAAGEIIDHQFLGYKKNPMVQIFDGSIKNLTKLGAELGLSPRSRADLLKILPVKQNKSAADEMKEFLG